MTVLLFTCCIGKQHDYSLKCFSLLNVVLESFAAGHVKFGIARDYKHVCKFNMKTNFSCM
jgi:hypothetical protein